MPPVEPLSLDWHGGLTFRNAPGSPAITLDSGVPGVTTPTQALAYALMACMGMDIVDLLRKGRHDVTALSVRLEGVRADAAPRCYTAMRVHFDLTARVERRKVERAIALSRDKYCSVWHTISRDVDLATSFTIHPVDADPSFSPSD